MSAYYAYTINYKETDGLKHARRLEADGKVKITFVGIERDVHHKLSQRWGKYLVEPMSICANCGGNGIVTQYEDGTCDDEHSRCENVCHICNGKGYITK